MSKLQRYQPPGLPSRLTRFREAVRAYWLGPILSSDPQAASFFGSGSRTASGVSVNEFTALNYAAVFAATNIIAGDIASFPLMMYKREKGGKTRFDSNPLYRVIHDQPNAEMTSVVWRKTMQAHALTWGNGYSEIQRDGAGRPTALWPITPDRVTPFRRSSDAPLEYRVVHRDGADVFIPAADMIHVPGLGFDGVLGYSVIAKARESFGLGMAAEQFGNTLYGNGLAFGGVISYPGARPSELSDKNYVASLKREHQGVANAHQILSLYNGAKYEKSSIPPNDAQFLETRQFQISEVARWFNLPPHKLGDLQRATHSNIEQQTIDYYTGTLLPWLTVWEQELLIKLVPNSERKIQFFEHVVDGLLRGDSAGRGELYSKRFNTASFTPNDIRRLENDNEIAGGDEAFVPLNMIPLSLAKPYFEAEIESKKAKAEADRRPPPVPVKADPAGPTAAEMKALEDALSIARNLTQRAEDAKDVAVALRVSAEQARDVALADVAALKTMTEGLSLDVVTAERSLDAERAAHAATDLRQTTIIAAKDREQAASLAEMIRARDHEQSARATDVERLTAKAEMIEGDYRRVCEEKLALESQVMDRDAKLIEAVAARIASETALREAQAAHELVLVGLRSELEQAGRALAAAALAKGELRQAAEVREAILVELRAQVGALTADVATGVLAIAEATEAKGRAETARDSAITARAVAVEQTEAAQKAAERSAATVARTRDALRGVLRDAAGRLLARETDRARKAQGSPEKLAKWAEAFYPMHEDVCRTALRPAVKAWLVAAGTDLSVDHLLDRVVPAFIAESTRQLRGLAAETDVESLAPALERILRRWDTERPDALVDRILREAA